MWNLLVFAMIGLLAGTAARIFYPGRQPLHILGSMLLGVAGGVVGGMISFMSWPWVEGEFVTESLVLSFFGAVTLLVIWAVVSYGRKISGARVTSR